MKTEDGFAYGIDGKVFVNTEERPAPSIDMEDIVRIISKKLTAKEYVSQALSAWNDSCIEVENTEETSIFPGYMKIDGIELPYLNLIKNGQLVTFQITGKKAKITSINN